MRLVMSLVFVGGSCKCANHPAFLKFSCGTLLALSMLAWVHMKQAFVVLLHRRIATCEIGVLGESKSHVVDERDTSLCESGVPFQ